MFWKKKEVKVLIDSNPPAKAAALAVRNTYMEKHITFAYEWMIKRINEAIDRGDLSIVHGICPGSRDNSKRYNKENTIGYLAARRLRKRGFKVKLVKRTMVDEHFIHSGCVIPAGWVKTLTISWAHD